MLQNLFFIALLIMCAEIAGHIIYWYKTGKCGPEDDALAFVRLIFAKFMKPAVKTTKNGYVYSDYYKEEK